MRDEGNFCAIKLRWCCFCFLSKFDSRFCCGIMSESAEFTVENWPSSKIRQTFIDFFKDKSHDFVASCPVVSFFTSSRTSFLSSITPASPLHWFLGMLS